MTLEGVLFVDGHILGGTVDLAGGGDQHALGVQLAGGVQDVEGALDVGVHIAVRAVVGERNCDEGGQVEDTLLPAHGGAHAVGVTHVAHEDVDLVADLRRQSVDPAQRAERVIQAEGANFFAALDKFFGEVAANKAVCTGNHYGMCHCLLLTSIKGRPEGGFPHDFNYYKIV